MAERVAITRALHQVVDGEPRLFPDPLALPIIGDANERWMHDNMARLQADPMPIVRTMVCLRARFAEDQLMEAMAEGTAQYVILGAGLDTFAYRRPELASRLTVFEVDHPDTQAWKRTRLREAGIDIPGSLRFVPVDFNRQALGECLSAAGFRRDAPAFFSWLGVTYYLPRASITDTLGHIARHPAPSQVVFDFAVLEDGPGSGSPERWAQLNDYTTRLGEPWHTWFSPVELADELRELGFSAVSHLDFEAAARRYGQIGAAVPRDRAFMGLISARH